jgi:hypothetical protein
MLGPLTHRASSAEGHGQATQHAAVVALLHVAAELANRLALQDPEEAFEDAEQMCRLARSVAGSRRRGARHVLVTGGQPIAPGRLGPHGADISNELILAVAFLHVNAVQKRAQDTRRTTDTTP